MTVFEDVEHSLAPTDARHAIENRGAVIVDVRQNYERETGRIRGCRHADMDHLASEADSIPRERPVIVYSPKGVRSGLPAQGCRASGWDACNLKGGLLAWAGCGLPLDPPPHASPWAF